MWTLVSIVYLSDASTFINRETNIREKNPHEKQTTSNTLSTIELSLALTYSGHSRDVNFLLVILFRLRFCIQDRHFTRYLYIQ